MVEKFREILKEIIEQKGQVTFFAIMKMDDFFDKWSVFVSAPWATEENRTETFEFLRGLMMEKLTAEERATIARIGIYPKADYVTQVFLQFSTNTVIKEDTKLNGFLVHEAYVLASNQNI